MTYRIRVTHEADEDIIRNANWWAKHHSTGEAERWHNAIYARIDSLKASPESHPQAYENADFAYQLREAYFGLGSRPGYRILFTVHEDAVIVLAVRAAEQDWLEPGDLPSDPPIE
jgi:plasmid stabilization system protein ParE